MWRRVPSSFVNVIKQVSCVIKPFNESTEIEAEHHSEPEINEPAIASSSFTDIDFDNLHAESCSSGIHQPEPPESEVSTVYPLDPVTPPCIRQSRTAKKVSRKSSKVDSILANVEKKERERILKKPMDIEMKTFTDATLEYFRDVVKNARCGHTAKVEVW